MLLNSLFGLTKTRVREERHNYPSNPAFWTYVSRTNRSQNQHAPPKAVWETPCVCRISFSKIYQAKKQIYFIKRWDIYLFILWEMNFYLLSSLVTRRSTNIFILLPCKSKYTYKQKTHQQSKFLVSLSKSYQQTLQSIEVSHKLKK